MFNGRDYLNLEELLSQIGKTKVKIRRIDAPGIGSGDFVDEEEISVVRNGVVETRMTTHVRLLDCGHLSTVGSLIGACDLCGILACETCLSQCPECGFLTCRYCRTKGNSSEGILCDRCRSKENRKQVARALAGFFVSREEK